MAASSYPYPRQRSVPSFILCLNKASGSLCFPSGNSPAQVALLQTPNPLILCAEQCQVNLSKAPFSPSSFSDHLRNPSAYLPPAPGKHESDRSRQGAPQTEPQVQAGLREGSAFLGRLWPRAGLCHVFRYTVFIRLPLGPGKLIHSNNKDGYKLGHSLFIFSGSTATRPGNRTGQMWTGHSLPGEWFPLGDYNIYQWVCGERGIGKRKLIVARRKHASHLYRPTLTFSAQGTAQAARK